MLTAILSAAVLAVALIFTVLHLPVGVKRLLVKLPGWLQSLILHFGYAGWIGGVSGHLMGAPLAILWFAAWTLWLKSSLETEIKRSGESRKDAIRRFVLSLRRCLGQAKDFASEVREALVRAA